MSRLMPPARKRLRVELRVHETRERGVAHTRAGDRKQQRRVPPAILQDNRRISSRPSLNLLILKRDLSDA